MRENPKYTLRRRSPFFLYLAAIITLAGGLAYFGWERTWSSVYVPTLYPPFADMRLIQGAIRSVEHGYDPRIANWSDPWQRPLNYPMLWVAIGKTLNFTNERWFIAACATMVLCFVSLCGFLLFCYPSFGMLASLDERFHETAPMQLRVLGRKMGFFRRSHMIRILEGPD